MNLLILLIGGNPIANFALIKYFKENGNDKIPKYDKVMLIYTKGTIEVANNIKKLNQDVEFINIDLENKEGNLKYIQTIIEDSLTKIKPTTIHLNYTGGRKPMSIGAFLAVKNYNDCQTIYSDISPKDYKLTLEDGITFIKDGSISSNINISIEEFYTLHNLSINNLERDQSQFFNNKFCQFLLDQTLNNEEKFYDNLWDKNLKELKNLNYKDSIPKEIYNLNEISNDTLQKLQKFIKGIWLENYIFKTIQEIKDQSNITDIAWNIEAKNRGKDFEVDIVTISGYKSFVFSCTTDKTTYIKQKAFEADIRAKQLGGIGAKTILVSLANENRTIEVKKDMSNSFDAIGAEDIKNKERLKKKLMDIFK